MINNERQRGNMSEVKVKNKASDGLDRMTYREAAEELGVSPTKIYMLVAVGKIVPVRLPGSSRNSGILRKEIERVKAEVLAEYEAEVMAKSGKC